MSEDAVIVRGCVRQEGVSGDVFVPTIDVGGRPAGVEVLAERPARSGACELSGGLESLLDAFERQPTEVGAQSFKVGSGLETVR
jgi:hypothetical protein